MATAFKQVADNAASTTTTTMTSTGVTSIVAATGDGAKFPAPGNGFILTIWNGTDPGADANMEKVTVSARSTDTLTVSATTKTHTSPANIALLDVASNTTDLQTAVNTLENGVVYTTGTQTVAGAKTFSSLVTAPQFVGSNVAATSGPGTLLNPGTSQIAVTVPTSNQLSLIYMDIRNNQTTTAASNFYGMLIKTEGDAVDTGAAISIENNGKADGIYMNVKGKAGSVTTNQPTGYGIDLNKGASGENSSTHNGTGMHIWDWSTTDNGDNGPTFLKLSKEGNLNTGHRMLYIRGNQRHIELYTPEGTGYDGTKSVLKLFNNTATKFNMLASGFIGINKDPTVQLDITDAGEVGVVIANSATSDTRAKLSLTGNATNGRGHLVVSGKHSGFDGTQNGDGPAIFEMIGDNSATHPTKFAWTIAASTKMLKLDVTDNGAGGTITGAIKVLVSGDVQLSTPGTTTSSVTTNGGTQTLTNKTLTGPKINQILDTLGNVELNLTATASSINYLNIVNGISGTDVQLQAAGTDTNTGINLVPKGSGVVKANGVQVSDVSSALTLTNKRITQRINTTASSATPAINTDTTDQFNITALAAAITSMTSSLTGTPTDGQDLLIRIKDNGTARAITWGTSFVSSGVATLLATTIANKTHTIGLRYDSTAAKWVCLAVDATGY